MASEYLKWKYRDVKPEEPRVLTKKEKRQNWWYYHKWHVVVGAVLVLIALDIGKSALHIGEVMPDLQIAYVGTNRLPDDTAEALEEAFEQIAVDANHDGKVTVQLNQYPAIISDDEESSSDDSDNAYYAQASSVTLMADLEDCDSFLFLLEDYETFQADYDVLEEGEDGTVTAVKWCDLPALSAMDLGEYQEVVAGMDVTGDSTELVRNLWVARRGFWNDRTCDYSDECEQLWQQISER